MLQELNNFFSKTPTRPALAAILIEGLLSQLRNLAPNFSEHSQIYHKLLIQQHKLGWHQIFLGRLAVEWRELQDDFLSTISNRKKEHSGKTWVLSIITIIWKHLYNNWKDRNDAQHGVDAATREIAKYKQAITETKALYALRMKVQPRDQDLFYRNIDEHMLKEPTSNGLRQWLNTWKAVLLQSMKNGDRTGSNRIHPITNFYVRQNIQQGATTNINNNNPTPRLRGMTTPIPTSSVTRAINTAIDTLLQT
jgi:hypothetical protein